MSDIKNTSSRIAFLDYLRIFAFLSVLIGHKFYAYIAAALANNQLHITPKLLLELLQPFVAYGGAGVVVFFLVSGYIISHVLLFEESSNFLIRRAFRIYPLYIIAVIIQIIVEHTTLPLNLLIPRLLLIGDFFDTPYALAGVEWTLRVEIMFYVFMAAFKSLNFWNERKNWLVFIFLMTTILMSQLPAFPSSSELLKGYFLIYGPFLFVGSGFWLYEQQWINLNWLITLVVIVFINYFYLIAAYQPNFLLTHFAILGFLLFCSAWIFRAKFQATAMILFWSDLTYSVYLLHNFMFDFFKLNLQKLLFETQKVDFLALILLFTLCFLLHRGIERPANKLGRLVALKITGK